VNEFRTVAVLSLGFGLVGIDRFLIGTLYPVIARDLHLNYGDIGLMPIALMIVGFLLSLSVRDLPPASPVIFSENFS
jgi:predicted MFS family arabinose efflux permease